MCHIFGTRKTQLNIFFFEISTHLRFVIADALLTVDKTYDIVSTEECTFYKTGGYNIPFLLCTLHYLTSIE